MTVRALHFGAPSPLIWPRTTAAFMLGVLVGVGPANAAETFQQLKGSQIRAKFAGMEFTDEVHWGFVFERDGALKIDSMGAKRTGRWRVNQDQLCLDRPIDGRHCYAVWISGNAVQLREPGVNIYEEGVLQKP